MHTVQSYDADAELAILSKVSDNIITSQESKPVIVIVQDSLTACFLMTKKNMKLERGEFFDITMNGERPDGSPLYNLNKVKTIERVLKAFGKKPRVFNSRGLLSLLFPDNLFYEKKNNVNPEEPTVKIYNGVFVEGAFDKTTLGADHGSLIQIMNKEYGPEITSNMIDNLQFISNAWMRVHGFSIGLEDCMITSEKSIHTIKDTLAQCYTKAEGIKETTQNAGICEVRVTAALSQARDIGLRIAKDAMRKDNNFLTTVQSGTKGDYFNIAQITGLLGQQNLESKRVTPQMNHGQRSLPHYPFTGMDKEREYESKGFIRHSFIHGLTPEEFFFHAMSGREGVIDTSMGTARSGYIQRRIVKICEDVQVQYDNTVRDVTGKIYQFNYGENGFDATKTVKVDGIPQAVNIERLATRLNMEHELGLNSDYQMKNNPEISVTVEEVKKSGIIKKNLVEKIKTLYPNSVVNDEWSIKELTERLDAMNIKFKDEIKEDDEKEVVSEDEDGEESDEEEEDSDEDEEKLSEEEEDSDKELDLAWVTLRDSKLVAGNPSIAARTVSRR